MQQPSAKNISGKPRLLIILNRFVIGGQAADTIPLSWHLRNDFDILLLHGEKEKGEIAPTFLLDAFPGIHLKKIKYLRRSVNPFTDVFAFLSLLAIISKFKPHIVHTHGSKPGILARIAARILRTEVIIHTFHGHFFHSYFSGYVSKIIVAVERMLGKITTATIALSTSQKDELVNKYRILPSSKIEVIPLGFAFKTNIEPLLHRANFRKRYNLQEGDMAIGIVGRIVPVKNHSLFVKIIHQLLSECGAKPPAFLIIGDGDLRGQVEKELTSKNIAYSDEKITASTRVVFTSWLTNIQEIMNGLDIVVLTSLNEGTPLSIIEAQFFKKPVVATDAGGVKDSMRNGYTGFLVEAGDSSSFCQKLHLLIDNHELRNKMGEEGRKFVSEKFSKDREIATIKNFYLSLLNSGRSFD